MHKHVGFTEKDNLKSKYQTSSGVLASCVSFGMSVTLSEPQLLNVIFTLLCIYVIYLYI